MKDKDLYDELKDNNYKSKFYGRAKEQQYAQYPYGLRRKYIRIPVNVSLPEELKPSAKEMTLELFKYISEGQVLMHRTSKGYKPIDKDWIMKKFNMSERSAREYISSLKKYRIIEEVLYIKKKEKAYIVNPKYCMYSIFCGADVMYIFQDDMDLTALTLKSVNEEVKRQEVKKNIRSVKNGR